MAEVASNNTVTNGASNSESVASFAVSDSASATGGAKAPDHGKSRRNRKKKGSARGDSLTNTNKIADTVHKLGYSEVEVSEALRRLQAAEEEVSYGSLIDMSCVVQQENLDKEFSCLSCNPQVTEYRGAVVSNGVCDTDEDLTSEEVSNHQNGDKPEIDLDDNLKTAIENRKMELRSAIDAMTFQCRVCNCSRATILLLPCGHLASCDDCLMDVRRCPINRCNKVVRGTKEVYFV